MSLVGQLILGDGRLDIQGGSKRPGSLLDPGTHYGSGARQPGTGRRLCSHTRAASRAPLVRQHRHHQLHSSLTCRPQSARFSRTGITLLIRMKAMQKYIAPSLDPKGGGNEGRRRKSNFTRMGLHHGWCYNLLFAWIITIFSYH